MWNYFSITNISTVTSIHLPQAHYTARTEGEKGVRQRGHGSQSQHSYGGLLTWNKEGKANSNSKDQI